MQSTYLDAQVQNGAATPYLVHLLMDQAIPPDRDSLMRRLTARLGTVTPVAAEDSTLHFALPDYPSKLEGVQVPLQVAVLALEGVSVDELALCLRQSWTWPDAGEVAAHCRASLTLSDFYGAGVDRRVRLALFHGALSALLEEVPVRAVQWLPSQQVVAPGAYLEQLAQGEGLRGSAVNVRRYRLHSTEGIIHVVDTMGLAAFGLPDLQLSFTRLEPARVADWLYAQATLLFEEGEAFASRPALASIHGDEDWRMTEALSTASPTRRVLDITAGAYAPPSA